MAYFKSALLKLSYTHDVTVIGVKCKTIFRRNKLKNKCLDFKFLLMPVKNKTK